jgi:hypothetical protein
MLHSKSYRYYTATLFSFVTKEKVGGTTETERNGTAAEHQTIDDNNEDYNNHSSVFWIDHKQKPLIDRIVQDKHNNKQLRRLGCCSVLFHDASVA